jgi:DNA polymerase I
VALWVADSNKTDPTLEDILFFGKSENFKEARKYIFEEIKRRQSEFIFEEIEKPLIPIVREMQNYGILIDKKFLENLNSKYSTELEGIQKEIWKLSGLEFNVSSPKQLGEVLFEKLGLSVKNQKKTAGGAMSTKESELEKMKDLHPIVPLILEYRELAKLLGTYIEPISKLLDGNARLHPTFILAGAATGRMASKNPGVQNIPIGTERGRAIRGAFLAPSGSKLVALDYSQIELRIAAFLSRDEKLLQIFRGAEDVHTGVASSVFKVPIKEVTKEMRRQAKVINFGILYGMGVNALAGNLGSDRKTAQEFYNKYFEEFKGLADYIENQKLETQKLGFTKTIFGRRRYFEGIKSKIPFIKAAAERMAINAPIQGTQADLIKISMGRVDTWIKEQKLEGKIHLILQIHDELIYEMKDGVVALAVPAIKNIMQTVLTPEQTLGVPILVNSSIGQNWGEMR